MCVPENSRRYLIRGTGAWFSNDQNATFYLSHINFFSFISVSLVEVHY